MDSRVGLRLAAEIDAFSPEYSLMALLVTGGTFHFAFLSRRSKVKAGISSNLKDDRRDQTPTQEGTRRTQASKLRVAPSNKETHNLPASPVKILREHNARRQTARATHAVPPR